MVEEIIFSRLKEGQLTECDLTMREINLIRQSFISSLRSMMHNRIAYPREDARNAKFDQTRGPKRPQAGETGPIRLPATGSKPAPLSQPAASPGNPPPQESAPASSGDPAQTSAASAIPRSLWSLM
jgi:hypothetical protein